MITHLSAVTDTASAHELALTASADAGDRNMKAAGRLVWDAEDFGVFHAAYDAFLPLILRQSRRSACTS